MRKKLFVFDCEGVLTFEKSSWKMLHEYFGSKDNSYFAQLYRRGVISYLDWMKIDIALMIHSHGRPIKRSDVMKVVSKINIRPSARRVISEIVKMDHVPAVVSSGIDLVVKNVCEKLGITTCLYNELLFLDDELVPGGIVRVPLKEKLAIVKKLAKDIGVGIENTIYIGDDEWDIEVFESVPISIAVEPCGNACKYATFVVKDLEELLELGVLTDDIS